MNIPKNQAEFEAQLQALYKQFVDAEVLGETDEVIGKAQLDLILKIERFMRGADIKGQAEVVDQETLEKLANCTDSDDPVIASTVGIVLKRLADEKHKDAVKLLKAAIKTKQKNFSELQRAKASKSRKKNPITILIEQIVTKNPEITESELLMELDKHTGSVIGEIDWELKEIIPVDIKAKALKISGLKDILYKAKSSLKNK